MQWLVSTYGVINFPRNYFNTSQSCHFIPDASEMLVCYAKPLSLTYLESTLQHPRHTIQNVPSRPNFSYLSGNFSSCVTCNVIVNITIIQQNHKTSRNVKKDVTVCCTKVCVQRYFPLRYACILNHAFRFEPADCFRSKLITVQR